ncbi:hypothetical protein BKA63DRAFT_190167 [Paraphoma chrysanthemicola]|nr:hypothetical protein BKA63DRAFT_190167 [Paraphoma chrysanthemicola]
MEIHDPWQYTCSCTSGARGEEQASGDRPYSPLHSLRPLRSLRRHRQTSQQPSERVSCTRNIAPPGAQGWRLLPGPRLGGTRARASVAVSRVRRCHDTLPWAFALCESFQRHCFSRSRTGQPQTPSYCEFTANKRASSSSVHFSSIHDTSRLRSISRMHQKDALFSMANSSSRNKFQPPPRAAARADEAMPASRNCTASDCSSIVAHSLSSLVMAKAIALTALLELASRPNCLHDVKKTSGSRMNLAMGKPLMLRQYADPACTERIKRLCAPQGTCIVLMSSPASEIQHAL